MNSLLNTIYGEARSLSDVSRRERVEFAHRRGYASKSEERCIWWAGRHDWTKIVWMTVRTSLRSSTSESERSVTTGLGSQSPQTRVPQLLRVPQPQSSSMGMQEEKTARSIPSESRSQAAQPTHATPIRHRGASSATMSNSTISKIKYVFKSGYIPQLQVNNL